MPDCGAWLDAGQHRVGINGYAEIYKGAIELIDCIMAQVNDAMAFYDINLNNYLDDYDHGELKLTLSTSAILDRLFVPCYGGTKKQPGKSFRDHRKRTYVDHDEQCGDRGMKKV